MTVLASGGIDSTALIHRYLSAKDDVRIIHYQYGQFNSRSELESIEAVSKHYRLKPNVIKLGFRMFLRGYEMLGRNALFVLVAASLAASPARISLGIHLGPEYYDTSLSFVSDCQRLLDGYFGGTVVVEAPFVGYSKQDVVDYCRKRRVPLRLTYSCQKKNAPPCGKCPSCLDRERYLGIG